MKKIISLLVLLVLLVSPVFSWYSSDYDKRNEIILGNYTEGITIEIINDKYVNGTSHANPLDATDKWGIFTSLLSNGTEVPVRASRFIVDGLVDFGSDEITFESGGMSGMDTTTCTGSANCSNLVTSGSPELTRSMYVLDPDASSVSDVNEDFTATAHIYKGFSINHTDRGDDRFMYLLLNQVAQGTGYFGLESDGSVIMYTGGSWIDSGFTLDENEIINVEFEVDCGTGKQSLWIDFDNGTMISAYYEQAIHNAPCTTIDSSRIGMLSLAKKGAGLIDCITTSNKRLGDWNQSSTYYRLELPANVVKVYHYKENNTNVEEFLDYGLRCPQYEKTVYTIGADEDNNDYYSDLYNNYTNPVYQLGNTDFGLTVNVTQANITNVTNLGFIWNNTFYNSSYINRMGNISDGTYNLFSFNITDFDIPFVRTNNTSVSYFWNYSIVWQNGTLTNTTTTPNDQYIYWNNWINTVSQNKEEFIEYEELVASVNITDKLGGTPNVTVLFNNSWNDLTLLSTNGDYKVYTGSITVPPPESGIIQNYVWNVSLFYSNTTFTTEQTSIDYNATSYLITVTNCSDTNATSLVYYFLDEESITSNITSDMDIDINLTSDFNFYRSYSFEFRDVTNASICIYPPNVTYYADSIQQYWADDYRVRSYFLQNATLDNTTNYINLYQINETFADATGVTFKVTLSNNFPAEGYITKIQRYYVGLGSYITVGMVLTDNNGEGFTYVRKNDVWYKFITEKDYTVVDETDLTIVSGDTFPIIIGGGEVADYVFNSEDILSGCEYTNATGILTCTVSDPSNLASEVCLLVRKTGFSGYDICDTCVAGSPTTTIVCTVPLADRIDSVLYYSLTVNDVWFMEDGGYIDLSVVEDFGKTGLLISYMIVGTLFFIGISFEPIIGLILGTAGLYIGIQTELLHLDYGAFVGFALIVAIAIFKLKNKSEVVG